MNLRIAETFASIQGEGIWAGTPSTFIRVSGCNLRCVWCDTPYASWNPEGPTMSIEDLVEVAKANALKHVVLTGGEPMLFEPVESLTQRLHQLGHVITIETAGTIYRDVACDLMSISPKLANSTPPQNSGWAGRHEKTRKDLDPLIRLIGGYDFQLKFVVNPELGDDIAEIDAILNQLPPIDPNRILLMPEGTDSETLTRRARLLAPACMRRNWRLGPRLHVDLYGNQRGT